MKAVLRPWIARLSALLRGLGPYAAIELVLPGGSLIALFVWLYRHRVSVGMHVGAGSFVTGTSGDSAMRFVASDGAS